MTILCIKEGHKLRVHFVHGTEIAPQEAADEVAVHRGIIPGEVNIFELVVLSFQVFLQFPNLSRLAGAVQPFNDD